MTYGTAIAHKQSASTRDIPILILAIEIIATPGDHQGCADAQKGL